MAFCVACGHPLAEGGRFCPACGTAVAQPSVPEVNYGETVVLNDYSNPEYCEPAPQSPMPEADYGETVVLNELDDAKYIESAAQPSVPEADYGETTLLDNVYAPVYEEQAPYTHPADIANQNIPESTKEEQQACLDSVYTRLKHERLCWKICGFVWLGYAALFSVIGIFAPVVFLYVALMYLPLAIINLMMIGKVDSYINSLYNDCSSAVTRCGAVGMIVFSAFFNTIAMIFIIINFTYVRNNDRILKDVKRNQDLFNNRARY